MTMQTRDEWPDPEAAAVEAALNLAATLDHIEDPSIGERALRTLARAVLRLRSQVAALTAEHSGACDDMAVCGNCWTAERIDAAAHAEAQVAAVRALHTRDERMAVHGVDACKGCATPGSHTKWPCKTLGALDAAVPGPAGEKPR